MICSYGCGKEAKFFFKSGKGCCEKSVNSCEGKRKKDSQKKKGSFKGVPAWKIDGFIYKPWNKGKIDVYSEEHKLKISKSLKGKSKGRASTDEKEKLRKQKISETMKKNPLSGGLRKGSGKGKKGWYKGYWCDSSWELAWVIYHIDHNINFKRNDEAFTYIYEGEEKKYYPDFVLNNIFIEIKGRRSFETLDKKTKQKITQFKKPLKVLYQEDISPYLQYTLNKYGVNFVNMYEK
jgi:hypothetical protein